MRAETVLVVGGDGVYVLNTYMYMYPEAYRNMHISSIPTLRTPTMFVVNADVYCVQSTIEYMRMKPMKQDKLKQARNIIFPQLLKLRPCKKRKYTFKMESRLHSSLFTTSVHFRKKNLVNNVF